jgi:hypothetical protein
MLAEVLIYASCPRGTALREHPVMKFEKLRKKYLTNGVGCANIAKLLRATQTTKTSEKSLKKLEKSS